MVLIINQDTISIFTIIATLSTVAAALAAWKTVSQVNETEKDRELPIVIPSGNNNISESDKKFQFTVKNIGRGLAKDFYIWIDGNEVKPFGENSNISSGIEASFNSNCHIDKIKELLKGKPLKIKVEYTYRDIHERKFETTNMEYERQDERDKTYSLNKKIKFKKRIDSYNIFLNNTRKILEEGRKNILLILKTKF